jgi:hypothetical protein
MTAFKVVFCDLKLKVISAFGFLIALLLSAIAGEQVRV